MINISLAPEPFAFKVEFSYPKGLTKNEECAVTEMELTALLDALITKYGLNNGTEIVTNSLQLFMEKYNI